MGENPEGGGGGSPSENPVLYQVDGAVEGVLVTVYIQEPPCNYSKYVSRNKVLLGSKMP